MTAIEKRLKALINCDKEDCLYCSNFRDALAFIAKLRRENRVRREIERELFTLTEGMLNAQCPPWLKGDEPEECPGVECSKCWRKYFDNKLRKAKI